ncbi:hypothetical protein AAG565_12525 [Fontimonas sp. SYSU GA230001]|uniref:hypothetical protein n=1 Tax=Fontimonas sp. SYSU GA230001 TaxID=3142450 RepID=UPI0032B3891F
MGISGQAAVRAAFALALVIPAAWAAPAPRGLSGEIGIGFDSNVANVRQGGDTREDSFVQLAVAAETGWKLGPAMAMQWQVALDAQGYAQYEGLSRAVPALRWRWLIRPGAGFYAPVLALGASAASEVFDSRLRDADEYRAGLWLQQQLTTRISLRLGGAASWRDARHEAVFAGRARSASVDLDWQPWRDLAFYAGYQYRDGDLVSTAPSPPPTVLDAARASAPDDVFVGETAFRLPGRAGIATTGFNYSLSPRGSIDVQARHVEAEADLGTHYRRTQALASLLWRY